MPWFVNPWALLGLGLASAPIIIHLLNRRRFKVVEWAAMEFLLASQRKNFRRIRIEQLILLALRVLLVCVLIFLVARPFLQRALAGIAEQEQLVVLVFDTSMSLGYRDGSTMCYDRGIAFAQQLMTSLNQGDTWALVAAEGPGKKVTSEPSFELEAARAAVSRERLSLSDGDSNLPAALAAAEELLASSRTQARTVYLVTDMQRTSWLPETGSVAAEDVERLKRLGKSSMGLHIVDVGAPSPENLAVVELETERPFTVVGGEAVLRARVANFGLADATGVRPSLFVDGFKQETGESKNLPAGGSDSWEFHHVFRTPGAHAVTVELDADNLTKDDRRFLAVDVRQSIRVLCVDGEPAGESFLSETDYLRQALRPGGAGEGDRLSLFEPEVVAVGALNSAELPRYDAVVLANVARLDEPVVAALESYVREGGALLLFLGDQVDRGFCNDRLHAGGKGILPCRLGEAVGDASDRSQAIHIEEKVGDHPFVRLFREQTVIRLSSPFFFRHFRLEDVREKEGARVVCRFDGGQPAIVDGKAGKGRVVVCASSADDEWNDMPSWPMYLALVQEVLAQVARQPGTSRNLTVGEPLVRHLSPRLSGKAIRLLRPGESRPATMQATASGGLVAATYDLTDRAGFYELTVETDEPTNPEDPLERKQDYFAVNVRPRESDLRRITVDELRRVFPGFEFTYQRGGSRREEAAKAAEGGELWRSLAYVLLALAVVESILAQRFGR